MRDARIAEVARRQFNRISRAQLEELGLSEAAIAHRVEMGRLEFAEQAVFGIAPILEHDDWGRWMGATLTAPHSVLSHASAAAAWGFWTLPRDFEVVTRPGNGGARRHGDVLVHRSSTLDGDSTMLRGVPVTTVARTLLDLSAWASQPALARAFREAVRLDLITTTAVGDALGRWRGRRGVRTLAMTVSRYLGLPLERARSGAEVRALEILRNVGYPLPRLNRRIAGEEADLSWSGPKTIIEIDGAPFHLDAGEDARKESAWKGAGWTVQRIDAEAIYENPMRLVTLARAHFPHRPSLPTPPSN